jgi:LemA protein
MTTAIIVILALVVFYVVGIYNTLQTLKTQIKASIQEIGNQLKRQAGLIPNLEVAVKGQLKHEQGIYKLLTEARQSVAKADASGSAKDIDQAVSKVQNLLPQIQVVVESNPELKANEAITKFMDELTDTADKLTYARRSVIDLSQVFNQKLVVFPSNMIANMFGFSEEKGIATSMTGAHMEVSKSEEESPKVNL